MPLKKFALQITARDAGRRLDQVLADRLPEALGQPLSKSKVRKLVVAGAVYLNGKRVRIASKELRPGARVEAYIDRDRLAKDGPASDQVFQMSEDAVLYEDEDLIAVNKPAGLPTQPTLDEARDNLFVAVKRFLSERDRIAQPYLALHHRLDRDTSGVLLLAKTTRVNSGVADLFARHLAVKTYHALSAAVKPTPVPDHWAISNHLGRDRESPGKQSRFTEVRSGGDFAHTDFRLLEALQDAFWIEAVPRTGRTHQIRVHLSEHGLPILGDPAYGVRHPAARRTMLHAACLTFPHPVLKNTLSVHSPLPEDFVQCLRALQSRKLLSGDFSR